MWSGRWISTPLRDTRPENGSIRFLLKYGEPLYITQRAINSEDSKMKLGCTNTSIPPSRTDSYECFSGDVLKFIITVNGRINDGIIHGIKLL
jgi:hypothetical protein